MQQFLVFISVGAALGYAIYKIIKQFNPKKKDDCGCGKCS